MRGTWLLLPLFVLLAACGGDRDANPEEAVPGAVETPATEEPVVEDAEGEEMVPAEPAPDEEEGGSEPASEDGGSSGGGETLASCLALADVVAVTGLDLDEHSRDEAGSNPTCVYETTGVVLSEKEMVQVFIDPHVSAPYGYGDAVAGIGAWAEYEVLADSDESSLLVGLDSGALDVYARPAIGVDEMVELARAFLNGVG